MKGLNKWQVVQLKKLLVQHCVSYEDVQVELVDHSASAIEEKMTTDQEVNLKSALDQIYREFGISGFLKIVQNNSKELGRFWNIHICKVFTEYLRSPLLFISKRIYGIFYFTQQLMHTIVLNLFEILSLLRAFICVFANKQLVEKEKLNKHSFDNSCRAIASTLLCYTAYLAPWPLLNFGENNTVLSTATPISIHVSSLYFTLNLILSYLLLYQIPTSLLSEFLVMWKQTQRT